MKITIEVNVPEGLDLDHAYQSVTDAMYLPQNVTQQEYNLVASILNQLASKKNKKLLPNGFRDWVETHHEIVTIVTYQLDEIYGQRPSLLDEIMSTEGTSGLYDLCIDLTTDFCNTYKDREWDGDWIDTIIDFVNEKLK